MRNSPDPVTPSRQRRAVAPWIWIVVVIALLALSAGAYWRLRPGRRPVVLATGEMIAAAAHLDLTVTSAKPPAAPKAPASDRERLLSAAYGKLGIPYKWAAKGPDRYDCSGFTKAAYEAVDARLPDGSFNQAKGELPLESLADLAPGDLLFYRWPGNKGVTHVTLYWGDGWVIGTGSPRQPAEVVIYPLASDFAAAPGTVVTYRHIELRDES